MAIRHFFVAFSRPRLEYCSAVWCGASPALLMDQDKVQLRVARAIVRNPTLQDVSTLQQDRLPTLSWRRQEHCLGLLWQLYTEKVPPALQASLVPCAQLRSTRFPHFFVFLLLHRLITCRPFSVKLSPSGTGCLFLSFLPRLSLFLLVSGSTLLYLGYVQLWSLSVSFTHSFRRLPHFYLFIFLCVYVPTTFFCSLFSSSFSSLFCVCSCVVNVSCSQRKGLRLASCYCPILFTHSTFNKLVRSRDVSPSQGLLQSAIESRTEEAPERAKRL